MATLKDQTEISAKIRTPGEQIAAFCRRHQIRWLALFGSVLRDDFRPDSHVDVLIDFEPEAEPGLIGFISLLSHQLAAVYGVPTMLGKSAAQSRQRSVILDEAQWGTIQARNNPQSRQSRACGNP